MMASTVAYDPIEKKKQYLVSSFFPFFFFSKFGALLFSVGKLQKCSFCPLINTLLPPYFTPAMSFRIGNIFKNVKVCVPPK